MVRRELIGLQRVVRGSCVFLASSCRSQNGILRAVRTVGSTVCTVRPSDDTSDVVNIITFFLAARYNQYQICKYVFIVGVIMYKIIKQYV